MDIKIKKPFIMGKKVRKPPTFRKLTEDQRLLCIKMHVEGIMDKDVVVYIKDTWNISYTIAGLHKLRESSKYDLAKKRYRERYLRSIQDVPISNKRVRIDTLEKVRIKLLKMLEENPCADKSERAEFCSQVKALNEVLVNARDEMEKKINLIPSVGIFGDFGEKTDDELISEREELLNQARRVVPGAIVEVSGFIKGTEEPDL